MVSLEWNIRHGTFWLSSHVLGGIQVISLLHTRFSSCRWINSGVIDADWFLFKEILTPAANTMETDQKKVCGKSVIELKGESSGRRLSEYLHLIGCLITYSYFLTRRRYMHTVSTASIHLVVYPMNLKRQLRKSCANWHDELKNVGRWCC